MNISIKIEYFPNVELNSLGIYNDKNQRIYEYTGGHVTILWNDEKSHEFNRAIVFPFNVENESLKIKMLDESAVKIGEFISEWLKSNIVNKEQLQTFLSTFAEPEIIYVGKPSQD